MPPATSIRWPRCSSTCTPTGLSTANQKIKRHFRISAVPASRRNPAISPTFDILLNRLMAKRPEERLANMTLVREHLRVWFDPQALGTIRSTLASQSATPAEVDEP